jgi:hypothetical protein
MCTLGLINSVKISVNSVTLELNSTRQVNGFNVSFVNCDGHPNSYIAVYPNFKELQPTTYGNGWTFTFTDQFVEYLQPVYSRRVMPTEYFMFMEMHHGGCGTYTQTDGREGLTDILSASIGFR